ncbi:MAG: potassium transporter TrkG [candidate division WOR-3 bacterium]
MLPVLVGIILKFGLLLPVSSSILKVLHVIDYLVLALLGLEVATGYFHSRPFWRHWRYAWFDTLILFFAGLLVAIGSYATLLIVVRQLVALGRSFTRLGGLMEEVQKRPVALLALSFLVLIILGVSLLMLPAATRDQTGAPLITALFTATSAVCVTGLVLVDIGTYFSRFGQIVILVLIQLGGLGIMTFYAGLAALVGGHLGLAQRRTLTTVIDESRQVQIGRALRYILLFTLLAEGAGASLLFIRWLPEHATTLQAAYYAIFHAISAFCNAGFSLFSRNMVAYQTDPLVNLVVIGLIISGGLGFGTVHELFNRETIRQPVRGLFRHLTAHARLVLVTTAILIGTGFLLFLLLEFNNALAGLNFPAKLLAALFQAVTPRTAGFNTVPTNFLRPATTFLWTLFMFIGASPGGTGGGIKTTTAAVLFLTIRNLALGRRDTEYAGRTITKDTVYRAAAIATLAAAVVVLSFSVLLLTESHPFQNLLFEAVSAFGTVGLSTGITSSLSVVGRLCLVILMFTGRTGPLTLALLFRPREKQLPITYPRARIMVG